MNKLITDPPQDESRNMDTLRKSELRKKYVERLGDNQTVLLERVEPGDNDLWHGIGELRRDIYVDDRNILSTDVLDENGREYDEYDTREGTVHICAVDSEDNVVGYVRIVTKGSEGNEHLPAEKAFHTELDKDTIEISRLISKRSMAAPLVTLALVRALMHELNSDSKYGKAVATLEPFLAIHLDNMGIPIKTLIDLQETPEYNSTNMLVEMDYTAIVDRATEMDAERKFLPVYPEKLGPWFADKKAEHGLGRVALIHNNEEKND
jgi:N-acyl-L-homoserine lactone synthetase